MKTATRDLQVYLVEDSKLLLQMLLEYLQREPGVKVVGNSARADQAIAEIKAMTPDVVLTDIQLERGSGWDVLRAIAQKSSPSRPVAMVLSNYVSETYRNAARRLGADHFFDKSSEMALMLKTVRDMAGGPARLQINGAGS